MGYAIITDIHGNAYTLQNILKDAKAWGAQGYLFLGDYYGDFPWPNQVITTIRSLPNAHFVRGNKEERAAAMIRESSKTWSYRQMQTQYWNMAEITQDNMAFLTALPKSKTITLWGNQVFMAHRLEDFLPSSWPPLLLARSFKRQEGFIGHHQISARFHQLLDAQPKLKKEFQNLPKGLYLFGHSHMPWVQVFEDKLLVNGGGAGTSADGNPSSSYVRLANTLHGPRAQIIRLPFDEKELTEKMEGTSLHNLAGDWMNITKKAMVSGKDEIALLFAQAQGWAKEWGIPYTQPMNDDLWQRVMARWLNENRLE